MKNIRYLGGMLFLSLLLIMQITSCGGGGDDAAPAPTPGMPFLTSDLAGTWYMFATNGASVGVPPAGSITAGNFRGTVYIDGLGNVTSGSYTRNITGSGAKITGGFIGIDSSGGLKSSSSSFTTDNKVSFYLGSGKMDSSKHILSFVLSTDYGEYDLVTAIRAAGVPSLDLAATWYIFGAGGDYGQITVSNASDGVKATIDAGGKGYFTIDGNGLLNDIISGTSSVDAQSGANLYLKQGKINFDKDIIFFVAGTDPSNFDLVTAIRAGGTFTLADLSGTWFIYGSSSNSTDSTIKATLSGTMTLDSSGTVTGSYTRSDPGGKVSFTGGTVIIDSAGVLSGSATTDKDGTISFASGKMNAAKGMMSLTGSTGSGDKNFLFCIKGN